MTITIPDWAKIGNIVYIKDVNEIRGGNPNEWYAERVISYGNDGIFHQAPYCPVYYTKFSEYGNTLLDEKEMKRRK